MFRRLIEVLLFCGMHLFLQKERHVLLETLLASNIERLLRILNTITWNLSRRCWVSSMVIYLLLSVSMAAPWKEVEISQVKPVFQVYLQIYDCSLLLLIFLLATTTRYGLRKVRWPICNVPLFTPRADSGSSTASGSLVFDFTLKWLDSAGQWHQQLNIRILILLILWVICPFVSLFPSSLLDSFLV